MASNTDTEAQVPPNEPTYGVSMSDEAIQDLVTTGWPASKLESVARLPVGKSYNNKIYFLRIHHDHGEQEAVLKVNGRFFDGDKVQNEVACLRLLELYCPSIPAPRVLAWSENGHSATFISADKAEVKGLNVHNGAEKENLIPWLLISRVPGEPVDPKTLDEATAMDIATQLANIVSHWRHDIPLQKHCGTIKIRQNLGESTDDAAGMILDKPLGPGILDLAIRGIVGENIKLSRPITTLNEYYSQKLHDKLGQLESSRTYERNRHLLPALGRFRDGTLPKMSFSDIFKNGGTPENTFLLTHYDLSPRNVLVSGSPPKITGIVDFEFAGFFSPVEEFLNDCIGNSGDWPAAFYKTYMGRLEAQGIATPGSSLKEETWQVAYNLEKLLENIAPWWLSEGTEASRLDKDLREAEATVHEMLEKLAGH